MKEIVDELKPLWKEYCNFIEYENYEPTFDGFFKWLMER